MIRLYRMPTRKAIRLCMNTYPICDYLYFRDRRDAATLRYRNRAKIIVLMCEHKP